MEVLISLILLGFALITVIYLALLIVRPIFGLFGSASEKAKITKAGARLDKVDLLLSNEKREAALKELRKSFIFFLVRSENTLAALKIHHQNVLSRCLTAAEEMGSRAENIADLEHLLIERTELLGLYLKASKSFKTLKTRRGKEGKKTPTWSKTDYESRLSQITEELKLNEKRLNEAINKLFMALKNRVQENIVYH